MRPLILILHVTLLWGPDASVSHRVDLVSVDRRTGVRSWELGSFLHIFEIIDGAGDRLATARSNSTVLRKGKNGGLR